VTENKAEVYLSQLDNMMKILSNNFDYIYKNYDTPIGFFTNFNRKASKIAKKITAGGGAGIVFEANDVDSNLSIIAKGTFDSCTFETKGELTIKSFDAHGYDDGMSNVDGTIVFSKIDTDNVFEQAIECIKEDIFDHYSDDEEFI
jgi:hypothetical protein